jgi:polyisoprenoid-binding protein YceI
MNNRLIIFAAAALASFAQNAEPDTLFSTVKIGRASHLYIRGEANITDYSCKLAHDFSNTTIKSRLKGDSLFLFNAKLLIPVKEFDCGNRIMNTDFQRALKSERYPLMSIDVRYIILNERGQFAHVNIEIAEKTQAFRIEINPEKLEINKEIVKIAASQEMKMSDFGIKAPTAMFGLIKVFDELTIDILLYINVKETKNGF